MRDLSRDNDGLRFKISLRSDVYFLVRTSDESTDKIEGSVVWFSWTNHEILALLAKRIETFFGRAATEQSLLAMDRTGLSRPGFLQQPLSVTGKLLSFVRDTVKPYAETRVSLAPAQQSLLKNFLDRNAITVFVDDLDRGWQGKREDAFKISALLN